MVTLAKVSASKVGRIAVLTVVVLSLVLVTGPTPALAHCDAENGPVVTAAREALRQGDVKLILPYVKADAEAELTGAFDQALKVRKLGGSAQELADRYFFETAVRLHRAGEGASYTGLKHEADFGPALEAADEALKSGSIKGVNKVLDQAWRDGVAERFEAVQKARANADRLRTVPAQRERAEAELAFEQYVYGLYNAATASTTHSEGEAAAAH